MKGYTIDQWIDVLQSVGIGPGDLLYLSTQIYGLGPMDDALTAEQYCTQLFAGLREVIGVDGTLVVPTFTQQVGRYGLPYVHEKTECLTGIFSEFIRRKPESRRSLHPVFSVSAVGPAADAITRDISPVAFGRASAFDRLYLLGGKAVCAGFDYYSGHITSLMHYVETVYAVPYYYNKYVLANVWVNGSKVERDFIINVKYNDHGLQFDYRRYIDALDAAGVIHSQALGCGQVYAVDIRHQVDIGFDLLNHDIHAFLAERPSFNLGTPPLDGPPDKDVPPPDTRNWSGYLLGGAR